MMDWERYQPPPPPQVTVSALTDDDPPKAVVGALTDDDPPKIVAGDDRQLPIPAEKLEEIRELLKSIAEDPAKMITASELEDIDESSPTYGQYVDDFKVVDAPQQPPDDPDAAADPDAIQTGDLA